MQQGRASNTAQFVAFNRALGNLQPEVKGFSDPIAERFLPLRWANRVERARGRLPRSPLPFWMRGMAIFNQFRTVALDVKILHALPFEQFVILGAGLEGRAWRLPDLKNTVVFEVNHPDTQGMKKERATGVTALAKEVRFVGVDFGKDDLSTRLGQAGFDPGKKTFWLWEGVTMYPTPEDVQKTLTTIGRMSSSGSGLLFTYMAGAKLSLRTRLFLLGFGIMTGEPLRSSFGEMEIHELAKVTGWSTETNTGIEEWKFAYAPDDFQLTERQVGIQWHERVWEGRR